jgi:hypothetical protein
MATIVLTMAYRLSIYVGEDSEDAYVASEHEGIQGVGRALAEAIHTLSQQRDDVVVRWEVEREQDGETGPATSAEQNKVLQMMSGKEL